MYFLKKLFEKYFENTAFTEVKNSMLKEEKSTVKNAKEKGSKKISKK